MVSDTAMEADVEVLLEEVQETDKDYDSISDNDSDSDTAPGLP